MDAALKEDIKLFRIMKIGILTTFQDVIISIWVILKFAIILMTDFVNAIRICTDVDYAVGDLSYFKLQEFSKSKLNIIATDLSTILHICISRVFKLESYLQRMHLLTHLTFVTEEDRIRVLDLSTKLMSQAEKLNEELAQKLDDYREMCYPWLQGSSIIFSSLTLQIILSKTKTYKHRKWPFSRNIRPIKITNS